MLPFTSNPNKDKTMDLNRLHEILRECTIQLRKGEPVTEADHGPVRVTTIDFNPPESAARSDLEKVDLCLLMVGVDKTKAEERKAELIDLLRTYPNPTELSGSPSYIHVGGTIGDQGAAFQLFALGKVLGLWDIITPETLHMTGQDAIDMAGNGAIWITGFRGEDHQPKT